jgi:hypothetical protein
MRLAQINPKTTFLMTLHEITIDDCLASRQQPVTTTEPKNMKRDFFVCSPLSLITLQCNHCEEGMEEIKKNKKCRLKKKVSKAV